MSYHSNLVFQTLPKHVTMQKIEDLLETLYEYFAIVLSIAKSWQKWPMSWKHEKGRGGLRNVKTPWISMLQSVKRVLGCFEMHTNKNSNEHAMNFF